MSSDAGAAEGGGGGGDFGGRARGRGRGRGRGRRFVAGGEGGAPTDAAGGAPADGAAGAPPAEGGFGGGDRRGRRGGRGRRGRRGGDGDKEKWTPVTKLGRLVQNKKIRSLEDIYLHSLAIKEYQIIDAFLPELKDEVMKITPVQKQTAAGQRTKFKAWVIVGDSNGHIGLGLKCAKEVATAIRGAIIDAKLNVVPARRGFWAVQKFGAPHTVPCKVTGKCGSVRMRLVPAPKGTGLVAAKASKKVLSLAGYKDCYTKSSGSTKTLGNFIRATFYAIAETYGYLTPEFWGATQYQANPYQSNWEWLKDNQGVHYVKKQERGQ